MKKSVKSHPAIVRMIANKKNVTSKRKAKAIKEEINKTTPRHKFI